MTASIDPFTARAAAKFRHPAGTTDVAELSPAERAALLHALNENRQQLTRLRAAAVRKLRATADELDRLDRQLEDIEASESWLLA
jgi:hypothetical protein